jgi:hypothetical protein
MFPDNLDGCLEMTSREIEREREYEKRVSCGVLRDRVVYGRKEARMKKLGQEEQSGYLDDTRFDNSGDGHG